MRQAARIYPSQTGYEEQFLMLWRIKKDDPPQIILHEEIQFIKLILMNILPKMASGKTVTEEKMMELMLRFKDEKVNLAKQIIQTSQSRGK